MLAARPSAPFLSRVAALVLIAALTGVAAASPADATGQNGPTLLTVTANSTTTPFFGSSASGPPITSSVSGLNPGDSATVSGLTYTFVGPSYGPSTTAPTLPGTYSVTPSGGSVTVTPLNNQTNYLSQYLYVAGSLTITPVTPTISALVNDPSAKPCTWDNLCTVGATVSGLAGSDHAQALGVVFTYTNAKHPSSTTYPTQPGTYSVTPSGGSILVVPSANQSGYSAGFNYVGTSLVITVSSPVVTSAFGELSMRVSRRPVTSYVYLGGHTFQPDVQVRVAQRGVKVEVHRDSSSRLLISLTKNSLLTYSSYSLTITNGDGGTTTARLKVATRPPHIGRVTLQTVFKKH